ISHDWRFKRSMSSTLDRCHFFGTAVMTLAATQLSTTACENIFNQRRTVMQSQTNTTQTQFAIRPFRVDFPEEAIADLRRRIAATRLPEKETVADASQGVQLATMQKLARYWGTGYDFRRVEAT